MRTRTVRVAKLALAVALQGLGINRLCRYLNRRKVRIILYHGVIAGRLDGMLNSESLHIPAKRFAKQVAYLTTYYHLISLDEFVRRVQAKEPLPDYAAILTFDDGYLNNYRNAWPVLQSYRAPATLFVSTSFIASRELLWLDQLEYNLHLTRRPSITLTVDGQPRTFPLESLPAKAQSLRRLKRALKPLSDEARQPLLEEIGRQLEVRYRYNESYHCNPLDWEHLREMADSGLVSIGSHAVHHVHLDTLEPHRIPEELSQSRAVLEARLGRPVRHFAYPGGACTAEIKRWTETAGYLSAVATVHGFNDQTTDLFELRRNEVGHDGNPWLFKATVSGSWDAVTGLAKQLLRRG